MTNVYAWPPVAHVAAEWSQIAPVSRSRSLITGAEYVSAAQRRRRVATLTVSALSLDRNGAGYMEMLKDLLDGGVHLVRLHSTPINWHIDAQREAGRNPHPVSWIVPPGDVDWEHGGTHFDWWTAAPSIGVPGTEGGFPTVLVTNLPPSRMIVRPGEYIRFGSQVSRALRPAWSDADGAATIYLSRPLTGGADQIVIASQDTGVFAADDLPRSVQPLGQNWSYNWSFTEVFADERGPFVEVNPWN